MPKVLLQTGLQILGSDSSLGNTIEHLDQKFEKLEKSFKRTTRLSREVRQIGGFASSMGIANAFGSFGMGGEAAQTKKEKETERALRIANAPSSVASYRKEGEINNKFSEVGSFVGNYVGAMFAGEIATGLVKGSGAILTKLGMTKAVSAISGIGARIAGSALGAIIGGFAGSVIPIVGTIAGSIIGSYLGEKAGDWIGKAFAEKEFDFKDASLKSMMEIKYQNEGDSTRSSTILGTMVEATTGILGFSSNYTSASKRKEAENANMAINEKRAAISKAHADALLDQRKAIEWLVRE